VSIPFRRANDFDTAGTAAYLRIDTSRSQRYRAALLQINARGEPVEFTCAEVDVPDGPLWREGDARHRAIAELVSALMQAAQRLPLLILALANELPEGTFRDHLRMEVPTCTVAGPIEGLGPEIQVSWVTTVPGQLSPARRLLDALVERRLAMEPFDRTLAGLIDCQPE
jgi:hypothetical protein